jgi:hypothetical protein
MCNGKKILGPNPPNGDLIMKMLAERSLENNWAGPNQKGLRKIVQPP